MPPGKKKTLLPSEEEELLTEERKRQKGRRRRREKGAGATAIPEPATLFPSFRKRKGVLVSPNSGIVTRTNVEHVKNFLRDDDDAKMYNTAQQRQCFAISSSLFPTSKKNRVRGGEPCLSLSLSNLFCYL